MSAPRPAEPVSRSTLGHQASRAGGTKPASEAGVGAEVGWTPAVLGALVPEALVWISTSSAGSGSSSRRTDSGTYPSATGGPHVLAEAIPPLDCRLASQLARGQAGPRVRVIWA